MAKHYYSQFPNKYLKLPSKEFIINYDNELTKLMQSDISLGITLKRELEEDELFSIDYVQSDEYEIQILQRALDYVSKSSRVIHKLILHKSEQENFANRYIVTLTSNTSKTIFLSRRLKQLGHFVDVNKIIEDKDFSKSKVIKPNLINGKKPNISERYKIANDVFGIYETLNSKNISATEKHKLLAHVMGCNQQTARELFNGTQQKRTPIREDIINSYLDNLK